MYESVAIEARLLPPLVRAAARAQISVPAAVSEAVATWLADLDAGLVRPQPPEPRWMARSRERPRPG